MSAIPVTDSPPAGLPTPVQPDVPVAAGAASPAGDAMPQADIPFDDVLRAAFGEVLGVDPSAVAGVPGADDDAAADASKTAATDAPPDTPAQLTSQPLLPSALVSPAFVPPTVVPGTPVQSTPAGSAKAAYKAQVAAAPVGQGGGDTLWPAAALPQPDEASLQISQAATVARSPAKQTPFAELAGAVPAMSETRSAGTPSGASAGDVPAAPRAAAALPFFAKQNVIGDESAYASAEGRADRTSTVPTAQVGVARAATGDVSVLQRAAAAQQSVSVGDARYASAADRTEIPSVAMAAPVGVAEVAGVRAGEASLRLPNGDATQWRQPLLQALGDRIQLTTQKGNESAVIRLEPPQMGSIEIAIRHQSGALQINLSATHNDVLRQLQDISDTLRHDLGQRHSGDVSVQVTDATPSRMAQQGDAERQRQRQQQADETPGRALGDDEAASKKTSFRLARNEE